MQSSAHTTPEWAPASFEAQTTFDRHFPSAIGPPSHLNPYHPQSHPFADPHLGGLSHQSLQSCYYPQHHPLGNPPPLLSAYGGECNPNEFKGILFSPCRHILFLFGILISFTKKTKTSHSAPEVDAKYVKKAFGGCLCQKVSS